MTEKKTADLERNKTVVSLGEGGSTELAIVGGKGASLGRMVAAGLARGRSGSRRP